MIKCIVVYEKTKSGYSAYVPDLPGVIATGKTKTIVKKSISEAIQFHLEQLKDIELYDTVRARKEKSVLFNQYLEKSRKSKSVMAARRLDQKTKKNSITMNEIVKEVKKVRKK
jgi:predicted RNase H-like HicB family nuclease